MNPIAILLIIASMSSDESAQTWLDRGAEAFANMRLVEAAQHFEKAVEADPRSAQAQLSFGAISLFQYQNSVAARPDHQNDVAERPNRMSGRVIQLRRTPAEWEARAEKRRAQITEQNATHAASAERHLQQALELDPRSQLAMEYLAALYLWWRDPMTEGYARRDEARAWYQRILEIHPHHRFADYVCGVIDYEKAMPIVRTYTGFPSPLRDEETRRSVRAQAGPLLADSARHFLRSLEIDPNNLDAMRYLMFVRKDEAYLAETKEEAVRANAEAAEWEHKQDQIMAARARAEGRPWPPTPGATGSMTFRGIRQAGKPTIPSFPPDPKGMIPIAPPPPPPPPPGLKR